MLSNLDDDAWNDSIILQIYQETLKSHTTKGNRYKKRKIDIKSLVTGEVGEPGKWESVQTVDSIQSAATVDAQSDTEKSFNNNLSIENPVESQPTLPKTLLNESLEKMLNAWYESGYATGRYYALREIYDGISPPERLNKVAPASENEIVEE